MSQNLDLLAKDLIVGLDKVDSQPQHGELMNIGQAKP
jgi:hypothetical protein